MKPQFSLRLLLITVAFCAVLCSSIIWNGAFITGMALLLSFGCLLFQLTAGDRGVSLAYAFLFYLCVLVLISAALPTPIY